MFRFFLFVGLFQAISGNIDVKLELQLKQSPRACQADQDRANSDRLCTIPYVITLMVGSQDGFELSPKRMQDGIARQGKHSKEFFEDSVIKVPDDLNSENDRIFAGIKFYGLPDGVQDYFIIEVTKLISSHASRNDVTWSSSDGKYFFRSTLRPARKLILLTSNGCGCSAYNCWCCEHLEVPKIYLNETGCVNITYLPVDKGISLTFSLNGVVYYNDTFSARNPPPACFSVPYLKEYAELCLRIHDMHWTPSNFTGCIRFEAELYHVRLYEKELGCFHFKLPTLELLE